jgi:hypothetical protein
VDVEWNCATLGLEADFTKNTDTVFLDGLGTVTVTNTSTNAVNWFWDFGDGGFITNLESVTHAYTEPGIYTITQTAINYNCTTSTSQSIIVVQSFDVGMEDLLSEEDISVYPNPNTGLFTIEITLEKPTKLTLSVNNLYGQRVYHEEAENTYYLQRKLDISELAKGIYYVTLETQNGRVVKKVSVQ